MLLLTFMGYVSFVSVAISCSVYMWFQYIIKTIIGEFFVYSESNCLCNSFRILWWSKLPSFPIGIFRELRVLFCRVFTFICTAGLCRRNHYRWFSKKVIKGCTSEYLYIFYIILEFNIIEKYKKIHKKVLIL